MQSWENKKARFFTKQTSRNEIKGKKQCKIKIKIATRRIMTKLKPIH
jgi:hypothetical protein